MTASSGSWEALKSLNAPKNRITLDGGGPWGIEVSVDAYLVGPLPRLGLL